MHEAKYDFFYFDENGEKLNIDILRKIYDVDRQLAGYRGHIYCPECKVAKLHYVGEGYKVGFLRTNGNSEHIEGCLYFYEVASNNTISRFNIEIDSKKLYRIAIWGKLIRDNKGHIRIATIDKENSSCFADSNYMIIEEVT